MAQIYVAGPAQIHVGIGAGGALAFLGWSESGIRIHLRREWDDVPADLTGSKVPADVQAMNEQAFISCDLKIWNNSIYAAIASAQNPQGVRGIMPLGSTGRLMITEGSAYRLLIFNPYASIKAAMASFNHWNFFRAWLAGPDDIPNGSRASKVRTVFRSIPLYDSLTGTLGLYNADASGVGPAV